MKHRYILAVNAPIDNVFELIHDLEKHKLWLEGVEETRYVGQHDPGNPVGARFKQRIREGATVKEYDGQVTAFAIPERLGIRLFSPEFSVQVDYRLTPIGSGTRVAYLAELSYAHSLARVRAWLAGPFMRGMIRMQMAKFKKLAESAGGARQRERAREADWTADPRRMVGLVRGRRFITDRKVQQFTASFARWQEGKLVDQRWRDRVLAIVQSEWLADPRRMLAFVRGKLSDRKLRLFELNYWRLHAQDSEDRQDPERLFEMEERADKGVETDKRQDSSEEPRSSYDSEPRKADFILGYRGYYAPRNERTEETELQAHLLREIFGDPFFPVFLDPSCRTADVVRLAQAIYDERRFDDMPMLGNALINAGCTMEQILGHCRQPGPHVRGCWVLDLVLGKE